MEKATVSQLKNQLSAYLRKVRAGASVLILDRDVPVARLERAVGSGSTDERLARLQAAGLVRAGSGRVSLPARKSLPSGRGVLDALLRDRAEDR
jgi:antitoxin (DNA-binding transcriptional repressor) of toxin-antitoxin stability system